MVTPPYINIHSHAENPLPDEFTIRSAFPWEFETLLHKNFTNLSVGLHPWHVHRQDREELIAHVNTLAIHPNALAIGEAGLDRFAEAPLELQMEYFIRQVQIAEQIQKPLLIHCVRCFPELLSVRKKLNPINPWIIHGFNANEQIAKEVVRSGCYLSFGTTILKENSKLMAAFRAIPLDQIFLETDESPINIEEIYQKAATVRNITEEELIIAISNNFRQCFSVNNDNS
ncbi:MAG: TatD family hydrolase [Marinifilaceae bacterium]